VFTAAPCAITAVVIGDTPTFDRTIAGVFNSGSGTDWFRLVWNSGGQIRWRVRDASNNISAQSTTTYADDILHIFTGASYANNDHRVFANAAQVATNSTSVTPSGLNRTSIGMSRDSSPEDTMVGYTFSVIYYDRAPSPAEIVRQHRTILLHLRRQRRNASMYITPAAAPAGPYTVTEIIHNFV
jgi:hypothetical protein